MQSKQMFYWVGEIWLRIWATVLFVSKLSLALQAAIYLPCQHGGLHVGEPLPEPWFAHVKCNSRWFERLCTSYLFGSGSC